GAASTTSPAERPPSRTKRPGSFPSPRANRLTTPASRSRRCRASAADDRRRGPAARGPQLDPPPCRGVLVHSGAGRADHDTIIVTRRGRADQLVDDVAQHPKRIAFERIAPAARPGLVA